MTHVLLVCWDFPPHDGSHALWAAEVADALVSAGARLTVLTTDTATAALRGRLREELVAAVDPTVRLVRIPHPDPAGDPVVTRWPQQRLTAQDRWRSDLAAAERRLFPDPGYAGWRPRADAAAYRLHRADRVDLVVATGPPHVAYAPALHLAVEDGVRYVLDDRSGWLLDPQDAGEEAGDYWRALAAGCVEAWFPGEQAASRCREELPDLSSRVQVVDSRGLSAAVLRVLPEVTA